MKLCQLRASAQMGEAAGAQFKDCGVWGFTSLQGDGGQVGPNAVWPRPFKFDQLTIANG
jgi:hypothetical protein